MKRFKLEFARVVILTAEIEAESVELAQELAWKMEMTGKLGISKVVPKLGTEVVEIQDYESFWEVVEVEEDEDEG